MAGTEDANKDLKTGTLLEQSQQEKTLPAVIKKLRTIAQEQFNGRMYDNIYAIFMQLTTHEKRMLLKGTINILMIVEDKTNNGSLVTEAYVESATLGEVKKAVNDSEKHITEGINNVEEFNRVEMIRLKSKITIIVVVFSLVCLFSMLLVGMYLSQSKAETISMFTEFAKILTEMIGF